VVPGGGGGERPLKLPSGREVGQGGRIIQRLLSRVMEGNVRREGQRNKPRLKRGCRDPEVGKERGKGGGGEEKREPHRKRRGQ